MLAKELDVPHVINNAYGLQCSKCTHLIEQGCRQGRIDAFVQSTDKNFLVPVGGAIVAAPQSKLVDKIAGLYPGRASMSPLLDLFITLLSLGASGWKKLLKDRKENMSWFQERFAATAAKNGLRLLSVPANKISLACDLTSLTGLKSISPENDTADEIDQDHLTFLGSALFTRRVSGPRVVLCSINMTPAPKAASDSVVEAIETAKVKLKGKYKKVIDGVPFESYGAHIDAYPCCYVTAACALGATRDEMESFLERFDLAIQEYKNGAGRKDKHAGSKKK